MTNTGNYFQLKGKSAEKIVHDLAIKTFLTDWSYPNPMIKPGKELCDLLVVFDEIAIIWQIKDLKLDNQGRYKKAEVDKNLRQIAGARRQLFDLNTKIELSNPRRGKEIFNPKSIKSIYLISVLMGEGEECYSGLEEVKGHDVHVFTKEFIEICLNELDTISDFCKYLEAKEQFFANKNVIIAGGEQELLATYIRENRSFKTYEKADKIFIDGDIWKGLLKDSRFIKKKEMDRISYGWDSIINRIHEGSSKYEVVARELARANRFERRYLSKVFVDAHARSHEDKSGANLYRRILPSDGITYCFLFMDDPEPRTRRKNMLFAICYFARGKFPQNKKIIGIATEKKIMPTCSYDYVLFDKPSWTDKDEQNTQKLQKELGLFINPVIAKTSEDEYPNE